MAIIKLADATPIQINWLVAKCEGLLKYATQARNFYALCLERGGVAFTHGRTYSPSTDWSQAGPLIEREKIETYYQPALDGWVARHEENLRYGPTPLIAAMRCFVASKLGDTIEIPNELIIRG